MHRRSIAAALLSLAACGMAPSPPAPDSPSPPSPGNATEALARAIGDAACTVDADCATVPVGTRACGGPAAHVAWSRRRSNEADVRGAAARWTEATPASKDAAFSICSVLADPGAACMAEGPSLRVCRLRAPGGGGSRGDAAR